MILAGTQTKFLTDDEYELWAHLRDREWRLRNLYYIKDKHGKKVKFDPGWSYAQTELLHNLWFFSLILKARQLGVTTFFCILYLDQVLFSENKTAGIIAHTEKDAKEFFNDKIKFAWDNLPQSIRDRLGPPNTNSVREISFPNGSRIFVTTSTRGGTCQYLHVSEFGKICARYPAKAREIVTGSINAVEKGNFVTIESTAEGREGYFYDFCQEAEAAQKSLKQLSPLDFRFFFFPWWKNAEYRLKSNFPINTEDLAYFKNLKDLHQIDLDIEQMRWYVSKKRVNGEDMYREYPSIPEEAFYASIEGTYYAAQMSKVYEERRIRNIPYDSRLPVDTWWDLGMNDSNTIIFTQGFGNEIRIIDFYENHGEGLGHYVETLRRKGYVFGRHFFPHDVEVRNLDATGKSRRQTLVELGLTNIRVVERTPDIMDDIEAVRKIFSRFYFDEAKTALLVDSCNSYRKEWDDRLGTWKNTPRHDKHSHRVDPLRLIARAWTQHGAADIKGEGGGQVRTEDFF